MGWALERWWPVCRTTVLLCDVCRYRCCCCCCCCGCFVVCLCLLERVGVLCHPRDLVLGHAGGMPPTGANIAVLVLKTELTAGSSCTLQLAVVGLGVGMLVVWVPYYCSAAVCCLSLPSLLLLLFCFPLCVIYACLRVLCYGYIVYGYKELHPLGLALFP